MLTFLISAAVVIVVMLVVFTRLLKRPQKEAGDNTVADNSFAGTGIKTTAIMALIIPVLAIGLYLLAGAQQDYDGKLAAQPPVADSGNATQPVSARQPLPSVEDMLAKLEERLEREPEDGKGWSLLGKSYEHLGRHEDAKKAFELARALGYEDAGSGNVVPASVHGLITLDSSLYESVSATDTVFIFARAVSGPRMPVAILRRQAGDLPIEFSLDDSMAMSPAAKLSQFNQVIIGARISSSGNASASAGDLEGYSGVVNVSDAEAVTVTVDQAIIGKPGAHRTGISGKSNGR